MAQQTLLYAVNYLNGSVQQEGNDTRPWFGAHNNGSIEVSRVTIPSSTDVRSVYSFTMTYDSHYLYNHGNGRNPYQYIDLVCQISESSTLYANACGAQGPASERVTTRLYGYSSSWKTITTNFSEPILLAPGKTYYLWFYPPYAESGKDLTCYCLAGHSNNPVYISYNVIDNVNAISVSNTLYMNSQSTISWTPYNSNYRYTVAYKFTSSGSTTTIVTKTSNSSVSFTPPTSLSSLIPNSISGTLTIYVDTYSGDTLLGQYSSDFSLSIPTSGRAPTCASGWASASYVAVISRCLAGRSDIKATVDKSKITTNYNATIQSIWATCNAASQNFTESGTKTLTKAIAGSNVVTVSVSDSRGITTSTSFTITGEAYSPPSFSSLSVIRCNSSATESSSGTYYAVTPNVTFNSFSGDNTLTIRTRWKISGGSYSAYTTISNGVKSSALGEGHLLTDSSYIVEVYAYDTVGGSSTQTRTLTNTSVAATINLKSNGLGVCIGGYATQDKCFEIKNSEGWKSIISTGMYGSSLPSSGVEGQIFFKEVGGANFTMYDNVTQLGLSSGTTIAAAFQAMPDDSILITGAENFASSDVPSIYGTVEIVRRASYRAWVNFYGKEQNADYRRAIYYDGLNLPWYRIFTVSRSGYDKSGVISFPSGITTPSWTQYWYQVGPIVSFNIDATNDSGSELSADALLATGFPARRSDVPAAFIGMDWSRPFRASINNAGELRLTWMGGITSGQGFTVCGSYLAYY